MVEFEPAQVCGWRMVDIGCDHSTVGTPRLQSRRKPTPRTHFQLVRFGPMCCITPISIRASAAFSAGSTRALSPSLPPYQFGNQGVGLVRGAGVMNFDVSLLREFRFTERVRAELRGEFFNALNHTNFNIPGRVFGGAGFGVISGAGPARQVQVGARITF